MHLPRFSAWHVHGKVRGGCGWKVLAKTCDSISVLEMSQGRYYLVKKLKRSTRWTQYSTGHLHILQYVPMDISCDLATVFSTPLTVLLYV